jgi:hypothetical protein
MSLKEQRQPTENFNQKGLAIMREISEKFPKSSNPEEIDQNGVPFTLLNFAYNENYFVLSPDGLTVFKDKTESNDSKQTKFVDCNLTPIINSQKESVDKSNPRPEIVLKNKDRSGQDINVQILSRTKFKGNDNIYKDISALTEICYRNENFKGFREKQNLPPKTYPRL